MAKPWENAKQLGEWERPGREGYRIEVVQWKDGRISVREYVKSGDYDGPTKAGIILWPEEIDKLNEAVKQKKNTK